jgi:hypothetical protein
MLNSQKGFTPIALVIIGLIIIGVMTSGGYFLYQRSGSQSIKSPNPTPQPSSTATTPPKASPSPSPASSASGKLSVPISPSPTPQPLGNFIKVVYPNGGERFNAGETINIKWAQNDLSSCVLKYQLTDGTVSPFFVPVDPKVGSYDFKLESHLLPSGEFKAKVLIDCYSSSSNNYRDLSDDYFTVIN